MPDPSRRTWHGLTAAVGREVRLLRTDRDRLTLVLGLALVAVGVVGFLGVLDAVREMDDLAALDTPVLEWLVSARSPALTVVLTAVTTISGPVVLPILVAVTGLAWGRWHREWLAVALFVGASLFSTLVVYGVKLVVARPRPPVDSQAVPGLETSYSFPSGHTAGAATVLLVLAYLAWERGPTIRALLWWSVIVVTGTGAVALSRLYLGYHFVTDVSASVALAVAVLGGVVLVDRHRVRRRARA